MKQIGDKRKFEDDSEYKICEIYEGKYIFFKLKVDKLICPHCKKDVFQPRNYTFKYIEKLKNELNEIKYLGISTEGRYILLDNYIDKTKIENKLNEVQ